MLHGDTLGDADVPGKFRVVAPEEKSGGIDKAVEAELEEAVAAKLRVAPVHLHSGKESDDEKEDRVGDSN